MKLADKIDFIEGKFSITCTNKTKGTSVTYEENIVVDNAREILRNLVFGDTTNATISHLVLGDLNYGVGSPWDNPDPAVGTEKFLTHLVMAVPVTTKTKIVDSISGRVGIKFVFTMPEDQYNGDTGVLKIVELGLAKSNYELFTKKNKPLIVKDFETRLDVEYTLLF